MLHLRPLVTLVLGCTLIFATQAAKAIAGAGGILAAGEFHTCAIDTAGAVHCWGLNAAGQLGNNTTTDASTPVGVSNLGSGIVAIAAGGYNTCALNSAGTVQCWGDNSFGQLGNSLVSTNYSSTPVLVLSLSQIVAIAAGQNDVCALNAGGTVQCWGDNGVGELGNSNITATYSSTPVVVSNLSSVVAIAAGGSYACSLTSAGAVLCWGDNAYGELGDDTTSNSSTPVAVSGLSGGVVAIAAGAKHSCALTSAGAVLCWGYNYFGELGDDTTSNSSTPVEVSNLSSGVVAIAAGDYHTCALTSAGAVFCWGNGNDGQLGASVSNSSTPVAVSNLSSGVVAIAAGGYSTCALTSAGTVVCWGSGMEGELGNGTTNNSNSPVGVSGLIAGPSAPQGAVVAEGVYHACAITTSGGVDCWGLNSQGQLGTGNTYSSNAPQPVSGITAGAVAITAEWYQSCALLKVGTPYCWGYDTYGQLGNGTGNNSTTPALLTGLTSGLTSISMGYADGCAVTLVGGVQCWGTNANDALGNGTTIGSNAPVTVRGNGGNGFLYGASAVAAGDQFACAIVSGGQPGTVLCWGYGLDGELGNGQGINSTVPVQVGTLINPSSIPGVVVQITAGWHHACALTSAGAVWCWGGNAYGQVGNGTTTNQQSAVQVISGGIASIGASSFGTCAVSTVGGLSCWGLNSYGQLGNGNTTTETSPTPVVGFSGFAVQIAAGGYDSNCAVNGAGIVQCWGYDGYGELGDGNTTNSSSPVTVPNFTASTVNGGPGSGGSGTADGPLPLWALGALGAALVGIASRRHERVAVDRSRPPENRPS